MIIVWLAKILAALNANVRPGEIGAAVAYAFLLALIPAGNLLWFALLFLSFFVKINNALFFVFLAVFAWVGAALGGLTDLIGFAVLNLDFLKGLFTAWANAPVVPWTAFNHTRVMGGFLLGLVLFVPVFLLFNRLVVLWRTTLRERLFQSKLVQGFLKWPLVQTLGGFFGKIFTVAKELV